MKIKMAMFTTLTVIFFYLSLFVSGIIPLIARYKTDFRTEHLIYFTKNIIFHPIENLTGMYESQNPLLFITIAASILLLIYLMYKTRRKNYENVGDKYGVQGSSRWAKRSEIFKVPDQITIVPSKNLYIEVKKTMENKVGEINGEE